jgi:nicotinate-nucleotide adenylyltransferase
MKKFRIGLYGGSFNPPHIGHLIVANEALEKYKLDIVYFIPINKSSPKYKSDKELLHYYHRLNMLYKATDNNDNFAVSDIDLKRGGTTYTIDTIKDFQWRFPKADLYFVCGEDTYKTIDKWKSSKELKKIAKFIVIKRSGKEELKISSSALRRRIKKGLPIKYYVPIGVDDYIKYNNLYK